jgi:hypothetical protein
MKTISAENASRRRTRHSNPQSAIRNSKFAYGPLAQPLEQPRMLSGLVTGRNALIFGLSRWACSSAVRAGDYNSSKQFARVCTLSPSRGKSRKTWAICLRSDAQICIKNKVDRRKNKSDERPRLFVARSSRQHPGFVQEPGFLRVHSRHFTLSFIMVFIDRLVADVGTLRMTFSRRVTVVTTNKTRVRTRPPAGGLPAGGSSSPAAGWTWVLIQRR